MAARRGPFGPLGRLLVNRFRAGLDLPPGDSAIVSVEVPGAAERLSAAGVRASVRDGRLRASFHLYTTEADVDAALRALHRTPTAAVPTARRHAPIRYGDA